MKPPKKIWAYDNGRCGWSYDERSGSIEYTRSDIAEQLVEAVSNALAILAEFPDTEIINPDTGDAYASSWVIEQALVAITLIKDKEN